jgi:putative transposase
LSGLSASKKNGRKVGSLRFKGKRWFKTFTYNQLGFKLIDSGKRCQTLCLSKIGNIPIRCHRNIDGKIKQVTIKHFSSGKWYAFIIEDGRKESAVARTGKLVGIDLGSDNIVHDSDDVVFESQRYYKKKEKRLRHLQRHMSKKVKGSNNRNRHKIRLAVQHESVSNARDDFLHKISRHYVNNYDYIGVEDFDITKMVGGRYAKGNLDAGWGKLRQYTSYKAESAGKKVIGVDYRGTTQRCSQCGIYVHKEIWNRQHECPKCGFCVARDYNSALEIKRLTIIKIRQELPEFKHLEMEALPMATSVCEE